MMRRHVRTGQTLVRRQHKLVDRLEAVHSPQLAEAEEFLSQLIKWQDEHKRHLGRTEEEISAGIRDADGNLLALRS